MLVELSQQFDVHANQIKQWKDQLLEGATGVFGDETKAAEPAGPTMDVKTLHAKIGGWRCHIIFRKRTEEPPGSFHAAIWVTAFHSAMALSRWM